MLNKLQNSFDDNLLVEEEIEVDTHKASWTLDCGSTGSDLTDIASKYEDETTPSTNATRLGMHKRLRSDSNAIFVFKDLRASIKGQPIKSRHKRAPTCPADIFNFQSSITLETGETESTASLTDSECTMEGEKTYTNLLGKDITLKAASRRKAVMHCYAAFVSFSRNQANLESSFRVMKHLTRSSLVDINSIQQIVSVDTSKDIRRTAFRQLFYMASFYTSIAHTTAGLMLTIGALDLGLTPYTVQIFYFIGSSLYFSGSTGILFRAWKQVRDEWMLLQESRLALHGIAYPGAGTFLNEH